MNWLYRFSFKFSNNNNTRSNTGIVLAVAAIVLYWLTCTSDGTSSGNMNLVYRNRNIWRSPELCTWCSSSWSLTSFIGGLWCKITGWTATLGLPIAILYWIFARRDEVVRIYEGTVERFLIDQGGTQDLPDQPATQTASGAPALAPAPQRTRPSGTFWWLSWDFLSNVMSDLVTGFLFHRR